ncbi:MAG: hypothetical protein ABFS35_08415 [Bacteroidota bacterium]
MKNKFRQQYRNLIAIFLLVVIALPIVLQPGHYFLIEHSHYHHSDENSINSGNQHFNCTIDDFQLAKVTLHSFLKASKAICLDIVLKFPYKQINTKRELNIPFSLRAPPFL